MALADFVTWVQSHCPPLLQNDENLATSTQTPSQTNDVALASAVNSAAAALTFLQSRVPPLDPTDVTNGLAAYNK
jgi:hypothetical protein